LSGWERTHLDVEETNEVINFLVAHLDLPRCIEGDVRAPTLDYSYGPFAVSARIDRRRATIFFRLSSQRLVIHSDWNRI
jgi:hypothetical protein